MAESKAKPKAKRESRASGAAKVTKTAKTRTTAKVGAKAKSAANVAGKATLQLIDQQNRDLRDWREDTLARMRALILEADSEMIEERKWKKPSNGMAGVPVWSHNGIVCTGEMYAKSREAHVRTGCQHSRPITAIQFQFGRPNAKGD